MSYATSFQFQLLLNFVDVIDMLGNISVKQSLTNAHVIKKNQQPNNFEICTFHLIILFQNATHNYKDLSEK